jgi:hypothetical protein
MDMWGVVVLNYIYYISRDTVKPSMIAIRNEILGVMKKAYVFGERDINGACLVD